MEELNKDMANLTIEAPRTGVTYHLDMLKHSYDPDPDQEQPHVEQPLRLKSILDRLRKLDVLKRCSVVDNMEEIDWKHVKEVHGERYVDYLEGLWPETKKHRITYIDTYYTKSTIRAARLAAESTRIAAEKVWTGEWENAFAIVRPPGHHAAAKNNKACGFCFINNVVTAAVYLQNAFSTKRIVILDWDVHHGDSSQLLTYDNPNILYISIHRYCHGSFYPGELGGAHYVGKDKGEGFNLNFPLNPVDKQFIGDAEYIYAFERAIYPIIRDFEPEFVFISSGFDCLLGDPLGALQVTQDALSYMLFKIKNFVQSKVVIALEGGYNLQQISIASECLTRVLLGDYYPNPANVVQADYKSMQKFSQPSRLFFQNTREVTEVWKKHWPILDTKSLAKYQASIEEAIENEGSMIGGHCKNLRISEDFILKKAKPAEIRFFGEQYPLLSQLRAFFPKVYGIKEKEGLPMVKFENMLKIANFNILHLKLADIYQPQKGNWEFLEKYRFYIPAYIIKNANGDVIEKRLKVFNKVDEGQVNSFMKRIFRFKSYEDAKVVVDKITAFIKKLQSIVDADKLSISSSSIVILYDPGLKKFKIMLMDMNNFSYEHNQNLGIVLNGITAYFASLLGVYQAKFQAKAV